MKINIDQDEIVKIIRKHLINSGADPRTINDITILFDNRLKECYCEADLDLDISDIFNSKDSGKTDKEPQDDEDLDTEQLLKNLDEEPKDQDAKQRLRVKLGSPKRVDDIEEQQASPDPLDDFKF